MAAGVRIVYVRTPAVCFRMHIVLLSIRFYAKVLNSINFSQRVMGYLEIYRIFVPELRRSLHIAKYRNEQKSARFHIVTYIIQANDQLLDFQSKSNLERVTPLNPKKLSLNTGEILLLYYINVFQPTGRTHQNAFALLVVYDFGCCVFMRRLPADRFPLFTFSSTLPA